MAPDRDTLSLGVEEEFQIINRATTDLEHGYDDLMRRATPTLREHMKPEFLQCVVECITSVCPDVAAVRAETMSLRATAALLARATDNLAIIAAGTHPTGKWWDQKRTTGERYGQLEDTLQEVARTILIYGLHVHVNVEDEARRIAVVNQARTFLPHILALSANSPFWMGRLTGYMSFRTMVWAPFPFAGIPDPFPTLDAYLDYRALFEQVGALGKVRRVWWDIRPHHLHPTVEFRIADMPMRHEETVAIIAFIQALVKTIVWRIEHDQPLPVLPTTYLNENRWRAARYGLRGKLVDYEARREVPAIDAIASALDLVTDAAADLGTLAEIGFLRSMLDPHYRCGAERQIEAYKQRYDPRDATRLLMEETLRDIDLGTALPLASDTEGKDTGRWSRNPLARLRRPHAVAAQG